MKRHLVGIGGVGMSALATALVRLGDKVTGSDRNLSTPNIAFLRTIGVEVFPDDGSGVAADTDEVVVSTAIEETNADLLKARRMGIRTTHRAAALAAALSPYKLVAVAGTCGKSTVTAMLGHILAECGFDPMCVNGANVPGWEGAVRFGRGDFAVGTFDGKANVSAVPVLRLLNCLKFRKRTAENEGCEGIAALENLAADIFEAMAECYLGNQL